MMRVRLPWIFVTVLLVLLAAAVGVYLGQARPTPVVAPTPMPDRATPTVPRPPDTLVAPRSWLPLAGTSAWAPRGALRFASAFGVPVAYMPSRATPAPGTWTAYKNTAHGFSVLYPTAWLELGAGQGVAIYPPATNVNTDQPGGPPGIVVQWLAQSPQQAVAALLPPAGDGAVDDLGLVRSGVQAGRLYSVGSAMGSALIAAFPWRGGALVLAARADDGALIDIYHQMLHSIAPV